jgi:coenzyme F420-dependent glucose-6-phosphate dehydrogenase
MPAIGYALSTEEHAPDRLVHHARLAEEAGFEFALISDHYHPWIDRQGESPFVWGVIGAIANATDRLRLGTGVTCPTIRIHPAIVAQAAATSAALMPGRFFLGVGSGENLNEHVVGTRWPPVAVRLEMLEEAIEAIRELWTGELVSHRGKHYTIENARLYTLPDEPPALVVAAAGPKAAKLAATMGDGLVGVSPQREVVEAFNAAGGGGKPRYGQVQVCWAADEEQAKQTALEWFPNIALPGDLSQELPQPAHFEQASELLDEDDMAEIVACGPDPEHHLEMIDRFAEAGFDHLYVHQIGPDQEGFMDFYAREVLPRVKEQAVAGPNAVGPPSAPGGS